MGIAARYLCVTDLETTGVHASKHEIIQIARVLIDLSIPAVMPETLWSAYVKPGFRWVHRDPEAMEVNKLNKKFLDDVGGNLLGVLIDYSTGVPWNDTLLAAWGSDFEVSFLKEGYERCGRAYPINYRVECIRSWAHLVAMASNSGELPNLGEACRVMGIEFSNEKAHNAEYDTLKTADIAVSLIQHVRWNR